MRPSSRTHMTQKRAALATQRIKEGREKFQRRLILTTIETTRGLKHQNLKEKVRGTFPLLLCPRTSEVTSKRM